MCLAPVGSFKHPTEHLCGFGKKKKPMKAVSDVLEENQFASVEAWLQMVASGSE